MRQAVVLCAVLLVALVVRLHGLGDDSLWLDEVLSVQRSNGHTANADVLATDTLLEPPPDLLALGHAEPAWRVWVALDEEVHPPLYYLALRGWRELGFDGPAGWRGLSVLTSMGCIVAAWAAARNTVGASPALWLAGLLAVAGPQIEQAQSNRGYTLLMLATLTAAAAAAAIVRHGFSHRRAAALTAGLLAAPLVHYAGLPLAAAVAGWCVACARPGDRRWAAGAVAAAVLVYAVAWGPFFLRQAAADMPEHLAFLDDRDGRGLVERVALPLAVLPARALVVLGPGWRKPTLLAGLAGWAVLAAAVWQRRREAGVWLWVTLLAGAVGPVLANDVLRDGSGFGFARYRFAAATVLLVFPAALRLPRPANAPWWLPATLMGVAAATLPWAVGRSNPPWRDMAGAVSSLRLPGDVVVIDAVGLPYWQAEATYVNLAAELGGPPARLMIVTTPDPIVSVGQTVWITPGVQHPAAADGSIHVPPLGRVRRVAVDPPEVASTTDRPDLGG